MKVEATIDGKVIEAEVLEDKEIKEKLILKGGTVYKPTPPVARIGGVLVKPPIVDVKNIGKNLMNFAIGLGLGAGAYLLVARDSEEEIEDES